MGHPMKSDLTRGGLLVLACKPLHHQKLYSINGSVLGLYQLENHSVNEILL